jgi:hypothetical protein
MLYKKGINFELFHHPRQIIRIGAKATSFFLPEAGAASKCVNIRTCSFHSGCKLRCGQ